MELNRFIRTHPKFSSTILACAVYHNSETGNLEQFSTSLLALSLQIFSLTKNVHSIRQ